MRSWWLATVLVALMTTAVYAATPPVFLYADTAPNAYGSPNWLPWRNAAFADAANGTFINMRSGAHPGTRYFEPVEEIVYSTMDLGKRLHWVYWVPGATIAQLQSLQFKVNWMVDWEGVNYVYNWTTNNLEQAILDPFGIPTNGWVEPSSWIEYDKDGDGTKDGVVGTFGFAWWATDDEAPPFNTDSSPYNQTDMDDVYALAAAIRQSQTHATGYVRMFDGTAYTYNILPLNVVPEPGTVMLWLSGLAAPGFALLRRRK
ncbi:MAG: PEP-CTERM sorting domain-containing protein [Chthonomonadetes bacterium]|nr:PEP-CTERM sorting domain-containing protein [Chthonomonadetes bacterium]